MNVLLNYQSLLPPFFKGLLTQRLFIFISHDDFNHYFDGCASFDKWMNALNIFENPNAGTTGHREIKDYQELCNLLRREMQHEAAGVLLAAVALLVVWQIAAMIVNLPILPPPLEVLRVFFREVRRDMLIHFAVSLWRVRAGMVLSVLVAAPAGLAIGGSRSLNRFFSPIIYLLYPIPKVVFVRVVILFLGIGDTAKIAILFLILFFQILVQVRDQASGIAPQLIQSLQ